MSDNYYDLKGRDLYRWTGNTDQYYSVRRLILAEGPAAGMHLIEITTMSGIRALFNESRALDLYELHYRGVNLGFSSKNGLAGPARSWLTPGEFQRTWPAGMLATCGLRNTGPDGEDTDGYHPLHGRIGQTAADRVSVDVDEDNMLIILRGRIRESALFGHNLTMNRTITIDINRSMIKYSDVISNNSSEAEPVFLLYHMNFGYPFLSPALKVKYPQCVTVPRTAEAAAGLEQYDQISEPVDGKPEQVFFHLPVDRTPDLNKALTLSDYPEANSEADRASVQLDNEQLNIRASISWDWSKLPVLTQWKSMKSGDYALGIEPGNTLIRGRLTELELDSVPVVEGFEKMEANFDLRLEVNK
jgi:hypothetical protein